MTRGRGGELEFDMPALGNEELMQSVTLSRFDFDRKTVRRISIKPLIAVIKRKVLAKSNCHPPIRHLTTKVTKPDFKCFDKDFLCVTKLQMKGFPVNR